MKQVNKKLGEILLEENMITDEQLGEALSIQKSQGRRLGHTLIELGHITENDLLEVLTRQFGIPAIKLDKKMINPGIAKLLPFRICARYRLLPILQNEMTLVIAATNPFNLNFIDEIKRTYPHKVELALASEKSVMDSIEYIFGRKINEQELDNEEALRNLPPPGSAIPASAEIDRIVRKAVDLNSKEIQIMFKKDRMAVFYLAGRLSSDQRPLEKEQYMEIVEALKLMAGMETLSVPMFQEGLFARTVAARDYHFRLHIFPTPAGPTVSMKMT